MILVDTNVLVDLWTGDPLWSGWSEEALARAAERSPVAVNPIIYAELCVGFEHESQLKRTLAEAGVRLLSLPYDAAWPAAQAFATYRKRGGTRTAARFFHRCARSGRGIASVDPRPAAVTGPIFPKSA